MTSALRPMDLHGDRGIILVRGEGAYLYGADGREYLDMMSNYGVNILGHADPEVAGAIAGQAGRLGNAHQSFGSHARDDFITALSALLPPELTRLCLANSGAETVEAALKFARVATGRHRVIAMHRAYHGRTFGALSVTADRKYREPFAPMLEGVVRVPYDNLAAVDAVLDGTIGAIVAEPIQGEAGVRVPGDGYLRGLRERADRHGALLVLDEVQTAFRTGSVFAFEAEGVVPDILCLSKGIANGFPLGAVVTTERVAGMVPRGSHGSTFGGNPIACAAGAATLRRLADPELHRRVASLGDGFRADLRALGPSRIRDVRGRGLMVAVELRHAAGPVLGDLQSNGVIALPGGGTTIRFLPPVIVNEDQLAVAVRALGTAIDTVEAAASR